MRKLKYIQLFENFFIKENKEADEVDFKLTELKNQEVSQLKKLMVEKGLKVYYKIDGKEYKYKAPTTGSGWDAKQEKNSIHDSYLTWSGKPDGVIEVGIGKETEKAKDILEFVEKTFKVGYVIKKEGNAQYWIVKIEPK